MRGKKAIAAAVCGILTLEALFLPVSAAQTGSAVLTDPPCAEQTVPSAQPLPDVSPAPAKLTFFLFDGEGGTLTADASVGGCVTAPDYPAVYEDQVFAGWRTQPDTGKAEYAPGQEIPVTGDACFYAVWRPRQSCTLTFQTNFGNQTRSVLEGGTPARLPSLPDRNGLRFVGWQGENGLRLFPERSTVWQDGVYTPLYAPALTTDHTTYIQGYPDGSFRPAAPLTRAEAAGMLTRLMQTLPDSDRTFPDVPDSAWYARPAAVTVELGAILPDADGSFRPDELITRAEFLYALTGLFPTEAAQPAFSDVPEDNWAGPAIDLAAARGWVSGYGDGTVHPDDPVTRAEAVSILNRAMGRIGDLSAHSYHIARFSDLPADHWAFLPVMEAATEHTPDLSQGDEIWTDYPEIILSPGFHYVNGELTYVDPATGWYVSDTTVNGFQFDSTGLYTSGDTELDGYVKQVLSQITDASMSREEMLRAAYDYTRDQFTYLRRNYYQIGDTGWEMQEALTMFRTGYGNCYCFTAVFYYLSRQLGYESTAISGVVGTNRSPHGWVEIDFNGITHIFDPELEMAYRKKGVYQYDFFQMPYSQVPWPYVKG